MILADPPRSEPVSPLALEFLHWVASRRRTYAEAMEAWKGARGRRGTSRKLSMIALPR